MTKRGLIVDQRFIHPLLDRLPLEARARISGDTFDGGFRIHIHEPSIAWHGHCKVQHTLHAARRDFPTQELINNVLMLL